MSNPNNALGTNGAFGGRTSVNAFNDVLGAFSGRGVLSGWGCEPSSGLTVTIGGNGSDRDVAIAEDANGNKTTVNNISQAPIEVAIPAAPASNSRIDAIVAYIGASPSSDAITDNYDAVNLLVVSGNTSSSPSLPTDAQIRTAITADGASGATAYYVVLASVTISSGTTDIDATMISSGSPAQIGSKQISDGAVTADKIDFTTLSILSGALVTGDNTLSLSNGEWLIWAFSTVITPSDRGTPALKLSINGVEMLATYCGNATESTWENLVIMDKVTVTDGDTIKIIAESAASPSFRSRYIAVKLG